MLQRLSAHTNVNRYVTDSADICHHSHPSIYRNVTVGRLPPHSTHVASDTPASVTMLQPVRSMLRS